MLQNIEHRKVKERTEIQQHNSKPADKWWLTDNNI